MARKTRSYESDEIAIDYDLRRCIHAEACVRGHPAVFDSRRRPWIDPSLGTADEVARVVEACPSGALTYRRKDGGPAEAIPGENVVRVSPDGPLYLTGRLSIRLPDGGRLETTRAALCRCGHSGDKPFCDNSHREAAFADPGLLLEGGVGRGGGEEEGVLEVSPTRNGPVILRGPVEVRPAEGDSEFVGAAALCRCGRSANKPFCDGSHTAARFEAD